MQHNGSSVYVLAFKPKEFLFSLDTITQVLVDNLSGDLTIFVVALSGDGKKLAKAIKTPGVEL